MVLVRNHEMDSECGWVGEEVDDVEALTAGGVVMTALLVACAVCDDTDDGGVPLDVVSSTRRRGGSELDARMVCPVCATVHTVTVFLHVGAEAARRTAAAGSIQGEPGVQFGGRS